MNTLAVVYLTMALLTSAWAYYRGEDQKLLDKMYDDGKFDQLPSELHRPLFYATLTVAAVIFGAVWPVFLGRKFYRKLRS